MPAENPGPGFFRSEFQGTGESGPGKQAPEIPPPRLSNIRPDLDFPDTGRCFELFRQAVKCGLVPNASEHSRLLWMAAIERARTVEASNPAGVFLTLVKRRLWGHLSEGQFDSANERIKKFLFGLPPELPPLDLAKTLFEPPKPKPLSKDAKLIELVRAKLGAKGQGGLLFHALATHAGFTQERFERALAELSRPKEFPAPVTSEPASSMHG